MHAPAVLIVSFVPILLVALRLPLPEQGRPRRGHDVRVDDARLRPVGRLDQRLGDLRRRRDRDGVALGDRRRSTRTCSSTGTTERTRRAGSSSAAVVWIAIMTWICYRGIELSAETQIFLLSAEIVILAAFAVVALVKTYNGTRSAGLDARELVVVQPVRPVVQRAHRRRPARDLHLLGLGLGGRRQRGVGDSAEGPGQGGRRSRRSCSC